MTKVRRASVFAATLIIFGGCGTESLIDEHAADPPSSAETPIDPPAATPAAATAPSPAPPRAPSPPLESPGLSSNLLDPFGFSLFDLALSPDLLSQFLDILALDLVIPADRGGLADDPTFLELLCREGDDPDFVCRQRYGR